jgi:hypothetical protein
MEEPTYIKRSTNVPCWHCGGTDSISPAAIVDRDGGERKVPLCDRCYTTRKRWRGWRPKKTIEEGLTI